MDCPPEDTRDARSRTPKLSTHGEGRVRGRNAGWMTDETQGRLEKMRGLREQGGEKLDGIVCIRRPESVVVIGHTSGRFLRMPESQV
jgi:hypothetical protein